MIDELLATVEAEGESIDRRIAAKAAEEWGFDGKNAPKWARKLLKRRAELRDAEDLLRSYYA